MKSPWTEPVIEFLQQQQLLGLSCTQMSIAVNRQFGTQHSRNAVIGKLSRLGLTKHGIGRGKWPEQARTRVARVTKPSRKEFARSERQTAGNVVVNARRGVKAPTVPELTLVKEIDPKLHVELRDLEDGMCKWPVTDELFCGAVAIAKRESYCSIHKRQSKPSAKDVTPGYKAKPMRGKYF